MSTAAPETADWQPDDNAFASVRPNSLVFTPTSPPLPDDGEAIAIVAPRKVVLGTDGASQPKLVVSGSVRMVMGRFMTNIHASRIMLVVSAPDGVFLRRAFVDLGLPARSAERETFTEPHDDGPMISTWFHTDVFRGIASPPTGIWFVHAFLGIYRARAVRVEVARGESEDEGDA